MKSSKPIVIISYTLAIGGVERKIADMAQYITKNPQFKDREIYLILDRVKPQDSEAAAFFDTVENSAVRVLYKPQAKFWRWQLPFTAFIFWQILTLNPEVVLAFLRGLGLIAVAVDRLLWWRKTKIIISDDNVTSLSLAGETSNVYETQMISKLIKLLYPYANAVISPSDAAKADLIKTYQIPADKIIALKNWVSSASDISYSYKYDLIYVGRIDPQKNILRLIEIVALIKRQIAPLQVCIVGSGTEIADVKLSLDKYQLNSTVTLAGVRKNVSQYLSAAKVFCLTSRYEGLPMSGLEAMGHGLPIVTTAYPGAAELVQHGLTGYICHSNEEYANRIVELLKNEPKRAELGQQARKYVTQNHSETNLKQLVNFLL